MTIKRAMSAAAALGFLAASLVAHAADLPQRPAYQEPVVMAPSFSWTGFYLGGDLGWMQTDPKYTPGAIILGSPYIATSLPVSSKNGLTYGILSGFNYQMGSFVFGIEGDLIGWTVGDARYTAVTGDFITAHSKWGGSIRGRLGYAFDHILWYFTGGGAAASMKTSATGTGYSIGDDDLRWGWTVGGGVDWAFTDHWFTGVAYRYTQYSSKTFTYPLGVQHLGIVGFAQESANNQVTARVGFKF